MGGNRRHLPTKQTTEHTIPSNRLIHRHHVDQFVIHQRGHPLVGRNRLEGEIERRDLDRHQVARHRSSGGIASIRKICEQERQLIGRVVAEELLFERKRVQEGASDVRHQIRLRAIEVHDAHVRRFDGLQLRKGGRRSERERKNDGRKEDAATHVRSAMLSKLKTAEPAGLAGAAVVLTGTRSAQRIGSAA